MSDVLCIRQWILLILCIISIKIFPHTEGASLGRNKSVVENKGTRFEYLLLDGKDNVMLSQQIQRFSRLKRTGTRARKWRTRVSGLSNLDFIQHVLSRRRNGLPMSVNASLGNIQQRLQLQQRMREAGR